MRKLSMAANERISPNGGNVVCQLSTTWSSEFHLFLFTIDNNKLRKKINSGKRFYDKIIIIYWPTGKRVQTEI